MKTRLILFTVDEEQESKAETLPGEEPPAVHTPMLVIETSDVDGFRAPEVEIHLHHENQADRADGTKLPVWAVV
jgi:hypothetical protein